MNYQFYNGGSMMLPNYQTKTEDELRNAYPILNNPDIAIIQTVGGVLYSYDNLLLMLDRYSLNADDYATNEEQLVALNNAIDIARMAENSKQKQSIVSADDVLNTQEAIAELYEMQTNNKI